MNLKKISFIKVTNKYYQTYKERLWNKVRERYQRLSEEEKYKRQKNAPEKYQKFTKEEKEKWRYKNLSEEQKQELIEYRRNYYLTHNK